MGKSTAYTCGKLCRQYVLLAGLALLCLFLPGLLGNAVEGALSDGVSFSGISLAVTAPEGDTTPQLLAQAMGQMRDVSRYCAFHALEEDAAIQALADGEVAAVLVLPDAFIQGILTGENPDVTLLVDENRPIESLLTLWVGQSAADLLSAVQSGIYAVLEAYDPSACSLTREQVVTDINLRYVNLAVNRQDFFKAESIPATGALPVSQHYGISLLIWLCLSLAPLFFPVYNHDRLYSRRRLRSIGIGSPLCCASDVIACALVLLIITLPALLALVPHPGITLLCALAFSLFCALFGSLCALLTGSTAQCGGLSFLVSLLALFLSGGIIPPVLLPKTLQRLLWFSPVTWLRSIPTALLGMEVSAGIFPVLIAATLAMAVACGLLYRRRMEHREVAV